MRQFCEKMMEEAERISKHLQGDETTTISTIKKHRKNKKWHQSLENTQRPTIVMRCQDTSTEERQVSSDILCWMLNIQHILKDSLLGYWGKVKTWMNEWMNKWIYIYIYTVYSLVTQWFSQLHVTMAGPKDRAGFILAPV